MNYFGCLCLQIKIIFYKTGNGEKRCGTNVIPTEFHKSGYFPYETLAQRHLGVIVWHGRNTNSQFRHVEFRLSRLANTTTFAPLFNSKKTFEDIQMIAFLNFRTGGS
jgi:hypothetical protein